MVEIDPSASEDDGLGGGTSHNGSRCFWSFSCQLIVVQCCIGSHQCNAIWVIHVGCWVMWSALASSQLNVFAIPLWRGWRSCSAHWISWVLVSSVWPIAIFLRPNTLLLSCWIVASWRRCRCCSALCLRCTSKMSALWQGYFTAPWVVTLTELWVMWVGGHPPPL